MSATQEIRSTNGRAPRPYGPLTPAEILALPAAVDLATAGRALGMGRTHAFELAAKGQFPIPVLRVGRQRKCTLAAICAYLGLPLTP